MTSSPTLPTLVFSATYPPLKITPEFDASNCRYSQPPVIRRIGVANRRVGRRRQPWPLKLAVGVLPVVEVAIFTMSRSNWTDVQGALEEGAKVVDVDYRVSVSDKQLARKIHVIARSARWREIEEAALAMAAPFLAAPEQLTRALGRKFQETVSVEDATLGDVETL